MAIMANFLLYVLYHNKKRVGDISHPVTESVITFATLSLASLTYWA